MSSEMVLIERKLIEFALIHIHMLVAIREGVYHDQPSLSEDMKKLVDDGALPSGWYKLKSSLESSCANSQSPQYLETEPSAGLTMRG